MMTTSPITKPSLLVRLRDDNDHDSWSSFVDVYGPLVHQYLLNRGLQQADALDLTQDVMVTVSARIKSFQYNPKRGQFRAWLFTVVKNCLRDFWRKGKHQERGVGNTEVPDALAQLPNPPVPDAGEWNRHYEQQLFRAAAKQVRDDFQESTWHAFWETAVEGNSGADVAERLGITRAAVYLAKGRVIARIKEQVRLLQGDIS
jgi:RNA polymerase sigma-70 factor (ECF subfamily)